MRGNLEVLGAGICDGEGNGAFWVINLGRSGALWAPPTIAMALNTTKAPGSHVSPCIDICSISLQAFSPEVIETIRILLQGWKVKANFWHKLYKDWKALKILMCRSTDR